MHRILIANRGEIARRIIRTCRSLGHESIAVYADPDVDAPHVAEADHAERIGPAALDESYLSIDAILAAAERSGATHVHPGYGFLAERTDFAAAVMDAGMTWIGPSPASVASMGSKIEARSVADRAGVPLIPGYNESQDDAALAAAADEIGYPVLVKASAGGGGKGIRIAHAPDEFATALADARIESRRAFGDDDVIVERYITRPRHIEVQIIADKHGTVADLGTRECSVQRRYQKVLEEAPAPNLPPETEVAMRQAAVALASGIGYDSAGTVEFIVDAGSDEFFFLEMNTRIQVEHTVTEQITGVDLIALQIAAADGQPQPVAATAWDEMRVAGLAHSFEARINAENPWEGHVPQTGDVSTVAVGAEIDGDAVRWDAAIESGSVISPHYDSMVGKLVVTGPDRIAAIDRLTQVLDATVVEGVVTNLGFHRWLVRQPEVRGATVTTRFLDETPLPSASPFDGAPADSPWATRHARRVTPHRSAHTYASPTRDGSWSGVGAAGAVGVDVRAPFPGLITAINVAAGEAVEAGQTLCTIEAMKMLHPITVAGSATVAEVLVEVGQQVDGDQPLITFNTPEPTGDSQ